MQQIIKTYQDAPSNIAIVKYWGKKGLQEPQNPSVSFTLSKALTKTNVQYELTDNKLNINFIFEGKEKDSFIPKLNFFIKNIEHLLPYLKSGNLFIETENTFPHSSGIASSASSMASLAKSLVDISEKIGNSHTNKQVLISEIARLGSGSACRSTQEGWILWGKTPVISESSDAYGISVNTSVHSNFEDLQDSILVIRKGSKAVSSTVGHSLMNNHPYKQGRINQANSNIAKLLKALGTGDFEQFAIICEEEALSLHALMMSSSPGYTLMAPETLEAINRIQEFRKNSQVPLTFTLDAGPNIHLIYQKKHIRLIQPFIKEHLAPLCEDQTVIYDEISMQTN
ncbi:diphosphomevalonate/mevalonate 3,5-bisphosphate decarboxylase family protein [Carboxylicivirga caseinilyticus]|uniref:diphosphomevalonate/mevalonate 3,5-bisphosphate decarboxylase family protein n=1 Tax=Carboxylicivirga caseinilyticus TaxID=3417572 RepID=UPI003D354275|nr:diphosphomevalonate decarboxylase [Marinilabiliaceae bacterium A049]